MTAPVPRPRGWCPGALSPMPTGDGLLVRLRIPVDGFAPARASALAELARRHGNGQVDLSGRGNLQVRGVRPESLTALQDGIAGLGLLDRNARAEAVRNVTTSPLAGLDPLMELDPRPLAAALDAALAGEPGLWRLPPKLHIVVDAGGRLPLDGVKADLRLRAAGGDRWAMTAGTFALGEVSGETALDASLMVLRAIVEARIEEERAAATIGRLGRDGLVGRLGTLVRPSSPPADPGSDPGALAGRIDLGARRAAVAAALPFGRLDARELATLAHLATASKTGLRLTPWRAILLAPLAPDETDAVLDAVERIGLIVDAADPRLSIRACPGRPACASAGADVRADAVRLLPALAPWIARGAEVHLSGCAKGCAGRQASTIALTAEDGRYGLAFGAAPSAPVRLLDCQEVVSALASAQPWPAASHRAPSAHQVSQLSMPHG